MPRYFDESGSYASPTATGSVTTDASGRQVISAQGVPGSARTQSPVFQQPQMEEQEPLDYSQFFFEGSPDFSGPAEEDEYRETKKEWFDAFARGYHEREFSTIEDYVKYGMGLPGAYAETEAYIRKQMKEYMPQKMRRQLEDMEAESDEERKWKRSIQRMNEFNRDPENMKNGVQIDLQGRQVQKNVDLDFKRKIDLAKEIREQGKVIAKSMQDVVVSMQTATSGEDGAKNPETIRILRAQYQVLQQAEKIYSDALKRVYGDSEFAIQKPDVQGQQDSGGEGEYPTLTPEQASSVPAGTMYRGTDGRLRRR